jgi:hypothetical protein
VIRYLVPRIERSYVALNALVDAIDQLALERRQRSPFRSRATRWR